MKPTPFLLLCSLLAGGPVCAADPTPGGPAPKASPNSKDPDALIETLLRHVMPTPQHKLLNPMAGRWVASIRYRMGPEAEVVETTCAAERKWVLGGRFLMEEMEGGNLVLPFRGLGLFGYDVFEQKHTSAWMDTMNTAVLFNLGTYDKTNDLVNFAGEYKDPWTGTKKKERGLLRFLGQDKHILEIHVAEPEGREFKMIEITYTRKPGDPK